MADVDINKFRASVVRDGSKPASPGFIVSEGQSPTDPAGSGQNHLPVTIATAATGLSITESQVLGGAGNVGQYIRGDGSLADFPESSGGGSSISYYLNGSVAQGTIGGVAYKELNKVPILGAGTDFTINADGYIASFLTDAGDPNLLEIPGGNWNFETYFSSSSSGGTPSFYVELYKVNSGGTATLIASNSGFPELIAFGTNIISYFSTLAVPTTALALTDRLAIRYYVTHSGRTITLHTEDNHLCQIVTTFTTGITALNGLTAQVQNFAVGTSGTDFNIASATATHTFNLPTASATNRGALSSADWTTFNNKTSNLGTVTSVGLSSATSGVTIGSTPVTTSGTITLAIATASGSQNGLLSSTDWTTFNGKQNALTNPVTGTGTTNYLPKFTGSTTIGNSNLINDASGNLGLGVTPSSWGVITAMQIKNAFVGGVNDNSYFGTNAYYDGSFYRYINTNFANLYSQQSGQHQFYTAPSGTAGNAISFTQAMTLNASGNLLVGTTTDNGARLQVSGKGTFSAPSGQNALVVNGVNSIFAQNIVAGTGTSTSFGLTISAGTNSSDIAFQVYNAAENAVRLFVRGDGNVGIGVTNPAAELQVGKSSDVVIAMSNSSSVTSGSRGSLAFYNSSVSTVALIRAAAVTDNVGTELQFHTRPASGSLTQVMTVTSSGNVGIGTTSPNVNGLSTALTINGSSTSGLEINANSVNQGYLIASTSAMVLNARTNIPLLFYTNDTERMRITSGGNVLIGTTTDNGAKLQVSGIGKFSSNISDWTNIVSNSNAIPYGIFIQYTSASPNNTENEFIYCRDGSNTVRATIRSNGGLANYQANNVNLSDERTKKEIEPLESYWDKFKAIEIVKFKYKDQTHNDFNIGVIAQQVEAVAPEFVDVDGWNTKLGIDEEGNEIVSEEEPLKSVYTADLYHATIKVLQEAMAKIEAMQKEIDTLKN